MKLDKLYELKDCINLSYIAEEANWSNSGLSIAQAKEYDMDSTDSRRMKMVRILEALRSIHERVGETIEYYENLE